jgi:hypothetical protein
MKAAKIAFMLLGIAAVSLPAAAGVVNTFDGSGSCDTFDSLTASYRSFMGTPQDKIDFGELTLGGGPIADFYSATKGVTFSNEGTVIILPEGNQVVSGWYQGSLAGYGGAGMPANGVPVYNKIYDDDPNSPLTIDFAAPVSSLGGYIANSAGGPSGLTITAFDTLGNQLGTMVTRVDNWGNADNSEGWWGIKTDSPEISRITILSTGNYGVATLGGLEFSQGQAGQPPIPEPATACLILLGGLGLLKRRNVHLRQGK